MIRSSAATGAHFSQTIWVGSSGVGERDRLDIADDMVGGAIAPGPAAGIFEHREILAREQLGDRLGLGVGRRSARTPARAPQPRISGRA